MNALRDFLDIPEAPVRATLDDGVFIEPKDNNPASEKQRQRTMLAYFARFAPSVAVDHIRNEGKATDWERVDAWRSGKRAGLLDLMLTWNRGIIFAEIKDGKGMPTPAQIERLNMYHRMGWPCGVFRTVDALVAFAIDRGCPVRGMR